MSPTRFVVVPTGAVLDPTLSPVTFRVLCSLSTWADKEGWCWPSQKTLAESLLMTRQTVAKHLITLEEEGYIESAPRVRESDGGNTSKLYRLLYDRHSAPVEPQPLLTETDTPVNAGLQPPVNAALQHEADPSEADLKKQIKIINEAFRVRMIEKYADTFTESEVRELIEDSLAHKSRKQWDDLGRHVDGWLRRAKKWAEPRTTGGGAAGGGGWTDSGGARPRAVAQNGYRARGNLTPPGEFGDTWDTTPRLSRDPDAAAGNRRGQPDVAGATGAGGRADPAAPRERLSGV